MKPQIASLCAVVLVLVYPLSIGPMARVTLLKFPESMDKVMMLYAPIWIAAKRSKTVNDLLQRYLGKWLPEQYGYKS